MFPLKASRKIDSTPVFTYLLIAVNVVVFLWQTTLSDSQLFQLYFSAGFVPCQVGANLLAPQSVLSVFSSIFLHGSWVHLLGNMMFLLAFGPAVEDYLGKVPYLGFYLLAGLGGSLMHMLFNLNICIPAIGASGAIMGVMGGFMLLYPGTRIATLLFFFRVPIGVRPVPALYLLGTFFVLDLLNGLAQLGPEVATTGGVAVWAHVGGFMVGFLMAFIGMTIKPLPPVDALGHLDD